MHENKPREKGGFWIAVASFAAPVMVLLSIFSLASISPFGDSSLMCGANARWFADFSTFRSALLGESSLFYSFSDGLGQDFYHIFANGFCSPFTLISVFFGASALPQALAVTMLLRAGFGGLFCSILLKRFSGRARVSAVVYSTAYASGSLFCLGFLAPQYVDSAVFLPLVAAGIALLAEKGKALMLFAGATLFFVSCGSLWPCMIMFTAIFFAWCQLVLGRREGLWARLGLLVASMATAVGAAMVVLIPAFSVSADVGKATAGFGAIDVSGFFDILAAIFSGAFTADTIFPLMFCSVLSVLMLSLYFLNSRLPLGERQICCFFILFMLVSMAVPALCWLWLGFSIPTGAVAVCGSVVCLFAVSAAVRLTAQPMHTGVGKVVLSWMIVALVFLAAIIFSGIRYSFSGILFTAAFLTMYAAITIIALSGRGFSVGFGIVLLICVGCECVIGGMLGLKAAQRELPLASVQQLETQRRQSLDVSSVIRGSESEAPSPFFRVRGVDENALNCASADFATTGEMEKLLSVLGVYEGEGFTPVTDSLFGIKYVVGRAGESGYTPVGTVGELEISRNDDALALGVMVSSGAAGLRSFSANPFTAQNELVSALSGVERSLFIPSAVTSRVGEGASVTDTLDGVEFIRNAERGMVHIEVVVSADGPLFMYLGNAGHSRENIYINGRELGQCTLGVINRLGSFNRGDTVDVLISVSGERLTLRGTWFAVLDRQLCSATMQSLKQRELTYSVADGDVIRASGTVSEGQMMVLSIPWQNGWSIYADGVEMETCRAAGALLGVVLPEGVHSLKIEYEPPDFGLSVLISAVFCVFGTIFFSVIDARKRRVGAAEFAPFPPPIPPPVAPVKREPDIFDIYSDYMIPDAESLDEHEEDFDEYFRGE